MFCVFEDSPTADFEKAVATQITDTLLLKADFHEVKQSINVPLTHEEIYILLTDYCDAFMGFTLHDGYPDWLTLSQPYYQTHYVLAVKNSSYDNFSHFSIEDAVGTRSTSLGDLALILHQRVMKPKERIRRFPFSSEKSAIEHLLDGTTDGALVWGPALYEFTEGDPESFGIHVISADPIKNLDWGIGIAFLSENTYLRAMVDDGIAFLVNEGVIKDLLKDPLLGSPMGMS